MGDISGDTYQNHIRTISVSYQYHISIISVSYQYHISTISAPYQYHISIISVPYQHHISTISVSYQYHISTISVPYQYHISTISGPYQDHISGDTMMDSFDSHHCGSYLVIKLLNLRKLHFRNCGFSTFSLGPLLRLKNSKWHRSPTLASTGIQMTREKAHDPLLERFLGKQRNNRSIQKLLLLESI